MIKNYFKIAFRSLWKNRLFSTINIISLAIGLCASFIIGLMVFYDFSFDIFHPDRDRIYRITTNFSTPDDNYYNAGVAVPLGNTLKEDTPVLENVAPLFTTYPLHIENVDEDKLYKNPQYVVYVDAGYFNVFKYQWLAGSTENILANPNEVVLTESRAKKYFPNKEWSQVIGSTLIYNDTIPVNVTGIVANFKNRTDLVFEEFISLKTANQSDMTSTVMDSNWNNTNSASQLFVKLNKDANPNDVVVVLDKLAASHEDAEMVSYGQKRTFHMQPLSDLHFNANYNTFDFSERQASKSVLISLALIALFLLLLGCINFINLNTAQATYKAKEIGVRKTLGSSKKQLVFQFLTETFLLTSLATILSLVLSYWLINVFSDFIPQGLKFELFSNPFIIVFICLLVVLVSFLSGFYPALVLSSFKPILVLKGQVLSNNSKSSLRKYLTVFQFVVAQVFIIATILVGKQINFLMTKDMGIKTAAIASVRTPWHDASFDKRIRFVEALKAMPQINQISLGGNPPASFSTHSRDISFIDDEKEIHTNLQLLHGDANYMDVYGIPLLAGRKLLNDSIHEYVINETYLKTLGFKEPQEAIGKFIKAGDEQIPIVGVMQDFHQRSLKSKIEPMAFIGDWYRSERSQFNTIHFSLPVGHKENWPDAIAKIKETWKNIYPDATIEVKFMDEMIKRFYEQEQKMSVLLNWATGLAILISCLGLLGLVIYTTERRTREIGIRKILGASLMQLNVLLCSEFIVLIGVAFIIAIPIAWTGLDSWLQDFAFKTSLSWWVFAVSGVAMLFIAIVIMTLRTMVKASANPVNSLRTE